MASSDDEYRSCAILMARGKELDPKAVSRALRMRPTQSWVRGEKRRLSKAQHLHQFGGWKKFPPESLESAPLERQLAHWVARLQSAQLPFEPDTGCEEFCIRCHLFTSRSASIVLAPELLAAIAALGIELQWSVFAVGES